ncbi:MAG TPA: hypothetical protein VEP90_21850 [Methylomirabilota bacterium]|nr:hypothetical protein [Methylomirabilota bacterium]
MSDIAPQIEGWEKCYERLEDVEFELAPFRIMIARNREFELQATPHLREHDYLYVTYKRKR